MIPYYMYSNLPKLPEHKVWAEIDTEALLYNYKVLCAFSPHVRHICAVKADAYGHVAELCVAVLLRAGCDFFAVACIEEALAVRDVCDREGKYADILILGYTCCSQAAILSENNIIQTVVSEDYARALQASAVEHDCSVKVHVALDTGMNRLGLCARNQAECAEAVDAIGRIMEFESIRIEGMFTHFARADEEYEDTIESDSHTKQQFDRFDAVRKGLSARGIRLFCHACNSAASVRFPQFAMDGVRFGIMLYGVSPSEHVDHITRPVMSLHTLVTHIHALLPGETVGYGGSFVAEEERLIATLPIGYADGFSRAYSGFCVTVQTDLGNFKAPVVGRVCMDQCMIDVTGLPVRAEDRVTVFGIDPLDLVNLAKMADTIEYEVLCRISARVPRIEK